MMARVACKWAMSAARRLPLIKALPLRAKKKKLRRRRTIAKPDASVEWQAERAMLAAREAQVIYDGMGWTLRVGSVRLCDV